MRELINAPPRSERVEVRERRALRERGDQPSLRHGGRGAVHVRAGRCAAVEVRVGQVAPRPVPAVRRGRPLPPPLRRRTLPGHPRGGRLVLLGLVRRGRPRDAGGIQLGRPGRRAWTASCTARAPLHPSAARRASRGNRAPLRHPASARLPNRRRILTWHPGGGRLVRVPAGRRALTSRAPQRGSTQGSGLVVFPPT